MGDGFDGMGGFDDIFSSWPETDAVDDGNNDLTSDLTGKHFTSGAWRSDYNFFHLQVEAVAEWAWEADAERPCLRVPTWGLHLHGVAECVPT